LTKSNILDVVVEGESVSTPPPSIVGTSGCYKVVSRVGEIVQLGASWSGGLAPYTWRWVWPDGYTETGSQSSGTSGTATTSRTFAPGVTPYTSANFTVFDSLGRSASTTATVTGECA